MGHRGIILVCVLTTFCACAIHICNGSYRRRSDAVSDARELVALSAAVEPPKRPQQFRNIEELNKYLAELRQYYTILGRPRFGRSVDRVMEHIASKGGNFNM